MLKPVESISRLGRRIISALRSGISSRPWLDIALRASGVYLVYGGVILFSSSFTFEPSSTPLFWPANGIVLCVILYAGRHRAPVYLGAAFLSYYTYLYFYDDFGLGPSFLLAGANLIEISAGYYLIRRFASLPLQFTSLRNTLELILYGILLNSMVGATAGTVLMYAIWEAPTLVNWSIWFGTSAIGYLMALPLIISWRTFSPRKMASREVLEMLLLYAFCFFGSFILFGAEKDKLLIYPYIAFPVLLWSAIRFHLRVTAIALEIFLIISAICSTHGLGPFAMGEFYREVLLIRFHLFCGILIMTVLVVSALESERKSLIRQLRDALGQIKTLRGIIPICSHCRKIRDDSGYWNLLENYIRENSEAEFSHGICPSCLREFYGEYFSEDEADVFGGTETDES